MVDKTNNNSQLRCLENVISNVKIALYRITLLFVLFDNGLC